VGRPGGISRSPKRRGVTLLLAACVAGTLLTAYRYVVTPSTLNAFAFETAVSITLGLTVAVVLSRKTRPAHGDSWVLAPGSKQSVFLLSALFLIIIGTAVLLLSRSAHVATTYFYVTVASAAGVVTVDAFTNGKHRSGRVLLEIVVLSAVVKFHYFYLNPYVYSSDSFLQYAGVSAIQSTSHVPASLGYYLYFPGYAIYSAVSTLLTTVPVQLHSAFVLLSTIGSIPLAYLVGRKIGDKIVGLLAALFTVFTTFFFGITTSNPGLFGIPFILAAIYALFQGNSGSRVSWITLFWMCALAALFSHPVNALLLFMMLAAWSAHGFVSRRSGSTTISSFAPALSYGVVYGGYLVMVALNAFTIFVTSFSSTGYVPPLATLSAPGLQSDPRYVWESLLAPLGTCIMFSLSAIAVTLRWTAGSFEFRFVSLLAAIFLVSPSFEFVVGSFRLQSSRFLVYLMIPIPMLAACGAKSVLDASRSRKKTLASLAVTITVCAFLASSSYLTHNDDRSIYPDVPVLPIHITEAARMSRSFMERMHQGSTIYLDLGSFQYFANNSRAIDALGRLNTLKLHQLEGVPNEAIVSINLRLAAYGDAEIGDFYELDAIEEAYRMSDGALVYSNGESMMYWAP
jgi:hypothetical protein